MSTYEIERKLDYKADKWELQNLQNENRELKSLVHDLRTRIEQLESVQHNRYYILEMFFNLLAEHPQFSELQNEIYRLKCSL
jgi:hypothetical protein